MNLFSEICNTVHVRASLNLEDQRVVIRPTPFPQTNTACMVKPAGSTKLPPTPSGVCKGTLAAQPQQGTIHWGQVKF